MKKVESTSEETIVKKDNRELIEAHENKKKVVTQEINTENKEFKLPANISIVKNNTDYYLTFIKSVKGERYKKMAKLTTNDFQTEYDNFIDLINSQYKDLVNFKKEKLYNIPTEYTNIVNDIKTVLVDNTQKEKPVMPNNFSICRVNDIDYIQFNKKIDDKRYQYKTKINSYDLQLELDTFVDRLNSDYALTLNKKDYIITNNDNWQTTNKIVDHTDTQDKQKRREIAKRYIDKKKQEIGEDEYKKLKAAQARNRRHIQL